MSIISWIILGLISGYIATKVANASGEGLLMDMVLGVVGAMVGGAVFRLLGQTGVSGFNAWSVLVSVVGAVVVLVAYHAIRERQSHA
jgi:uncharacterized membrane protein YeaQ/YmgE (transglycosylase-associated protein family)